MRRAAGWLGLWIALACGAAPATARAARKAIAGVVNLNTAPAELLALLPGIGPAKAAEIARYRSKRPFRTVDELVRIRGIGRRMVRQIRSNLAVAGPSTATVVATPPTSPPAAPPRPSPPKILSPARPVSAPGRLVARRGPAQRPPPWPTHSACLRPR